ncbi:hypothetical protein M666_04965 [Cellulophaga baltica 18]|uniref:Uncharacterized protein n=1 Tax=Cellulophaga baltica 18 TaxID=1348584 RepID=A0AAU8RAN4_9FLAO|nr:hypothetical protein M666_04965 [Cellulophaga baltica 18]
MRLGNLLFPSGHKAKASYFAYPPVRWDLFFCGGKLQSHAVTKVGKKVMVIKLFFVEVDTLLTIGYLIVEMHAFALHNRVFSVLEPF